MKVIIKLLILTLFFASCKKDKVTTVAQPNMDSTWKEAVIDGLGWDRILLNNAIVNNQLLILGVSDLIVLPITAMESKAYPIQSLSEQLPLWCKPTINNDVITIISLDSKYMQVIKTASINQVGYFN